MEGFVISNTLVARDIYKLELLWEGKVERPGQFVMLEVPGFYLKRPISICDWDGPRLVLVYRVAGPGTEALAKLHTGSRVDILGPLGNGFDVSAARRRVLVAGGGIGTPPLVGLCRRLLTMGIEPQVCLGFSDASAAVCLDMFRAMGIEPKVATMDGSMGKKGIITDILDKYDYYYTCGPMPMLKALWKNGEEGQLSLEQRMGCGFGVCMGCSIMTVSGSKRVCKEGPVFKSAEVLFDE